MSMAIKLTVHHLGDVDEVIGIVSWENALTESKCSSALLMSWQTIGNEKGCKTQNLVNAAVQGDAEEGWCFGRGGSYALVNALSSG